MAKMACMWKVWDANDPESTNVFYFSTKEKAFAMYPKIIEWSKRHDALAGITAESDWVVEPDMLWLDINERDLNSGVI